MVRGQGREGVSYQLSVDGEEELGRFVETEPGAAVVKHLQ